MTLGLGAAGVFSSLCPYQKSVQLPDTSLFVSELLVNGTDLVLDVNVLHVSQLCLALSVHGTIVAVYSSLLSTRQLVLGNCLPSHRVKDVAALAGKTL